MQILRTLRVEMPYDDSTLKRQTVRLGYAPHLKVAAGEHFACEAAYLGVYRGSAQDANAETSGPTESFMASVAGVGGFDGAAAAGLAGQRTGKKTPLPSQPRVLPLRCEAAAIVAMTSAILGPPRHGLMAFACGWHSEMQQADYAAEEDLAGDLQSLALIRACGLDGITDSHPWGGETAKMCKLREGDHYVPDPVSSHGSCGNWYCATGVHQL
jgi:hypothetical protein